MQTLCPSRAKNTAMLVLSVLLPHPPFAFNTITWRIIPRACCACKVELYQSIAQPPSGNLRHRLCSSAMRIEFLKMQGLGNDFLVFDAAANAPLDERTLRALADRHTGVGFDQALMLEEPRDPASRVFYRIFNSDGSEVEQCGNGARCIAALLYARAPELGRDLIMDCLGGTVRAHVRDDGLVSVDMGVPNFDPSALPMVAAGGGL